MPVTLKEVAERAGVSRSAVSRTFTPGASVAPRTRERVETAARELGYVPSVLASGLATGRTKLIGIVINNFRNPFFLDVFDRLTAGLQARGLRPLLVNLSGESEAARSVDLLRQYSVDGVIVTSSTLPPEFSVAFAEAGLPVIHAFARHSTTPDVNTVGIDNIECGRMAARELHARGYRRVAFLGGPKSAASTIDRLEGFLHASRLLGLDVAVSHADTYSFAAGEAETGRLLKAGPPAEAYFCGDDVICIGAMSALRAHGFSVPGDVGLIGVNDMDMAGWPLINLTTFRQPVGAIVEALVGRMDALLAKPAQEPTAIRLDAELVERGTLRPRA